MEKAVVHRETVYQLSVNKVNGTVIRIGVTYIVIPEICYVLKNDFRRDSSRIYANVQSPKVKRYKSKQSMYTNGLLSNGESACIVVGTVDCGRELSGLRLKLHRYPWSPP